MTESGILLWTYIMGTGNSVSKQILQSQKHESLGTVGKNLQQIWWDFAIMKIKCSCHYFVNKLNSYMYIWKSKCLYYYHLSELTILNLNVNLNTVLE